jgi:tetratricopeptide (TPR) repeat protein
VRKQLRGRDPRDAWSLTGSTAVERLNVDAGIGFGRFCVQTGRLEEAGSHLRRAGAIASQHGWRLASARSELERAALAWARGDHAETERLIQTAHPVIAASAVANDVARCWLYLGLTRMAAGELQAADQCWEQAQRYWDELGVPLHMYRILMQRSWIQVFRGRFDGARSMVEQARSLLVTTDHATWLHHARLDDLLGSIWRAEALSDMGFDGIGDPLADWNTVEARVAVSEGITTADDGSAGHRLAQVKFERAAALKIPAALAVDSVRHCMPDADARSRWARSVSAQVMAGAFAVAWEWGNTTLTAEMIEYTSARGTFDVEPKTAGATGGEWTVAATGATPVIAAEATDDQAVAAGGTATASTGGLTRLGPLPPLQMHPGAGAILADYRRRATERYGRKVTSDEPMWHTWT